MSAEAVPLAGHIATALDAEQAASVRAFGPNTLVVAGAGSGKTRVLTYGLTHLLTDHEIQPEDLMLLTFTRKAAEEMRQRAQDVAGRDLAALRCGTFHAVGALLLREAGHVFSIIDEYESELMLGQLGAELAEDREMEGFALDPARLAAWFAQAREEDMQLDEILASAPERYRDHRSLIADLQTRYSERKEEEHLLDYADLLWETRELLTAQIPKNLRAVLVDEVQDLNQMQRQIVLALVAGGAWLIQVGDAQQSIYGFRGASYEALLELAENPTLHLCKLETNYRSTPEIVALAKTLVPTTNLSLDVQAYRAISGLQPTRLAPSSPEDEARAWIAWADKHQQAGASLEELCVLARAHEHLQMAAQAFSSVGWPTSLLGRRRGEFEQYRLFLLALMRLAVEPKSRASWQRVLPVFGFAAEEQHTRLALLRQSLEPLELCAQWSEDESVTALLRLLASAGETVDASLWHSALYGPFGQILMRSVAEQQRGAQLLGELSEVGQCEGEGIAYLQALVLAEHTQASEAGIRLGTIHASKGLEWPHILIARCSYESFPSRMALVEERLDEEQRLFYVAVTRAEETITVSEAPWLGDGGRHQSDFLADATIREHFVLSDEAIAS